jgi:hypothetical protein
MMNQKIDSFICYTERYYKMGSCVTKENDIQPSISIRESEYDDRPYEERSKDEILESQTRQMIQNINRRSHGFH